jgi:hypothetical protein
MRRTSSVDVVRPDGAGGAVAIAARARDVLVGPDGTVRPAAAVRLDASLDAFQELVALEASPPVDGLRALLGRRVASGFRAEAARALAADRRAATALYLLVDDLPVVTLVSGYAVQHAGALGEVPKGSYEPTVDLCAGWRAGGTLMRVVDEAGVPPMTLGPPAPSLEPATRRPGAVDAWHELPVPMPRTVRRRRRIDVACRDALEVDAMFRDSHWDDDGVETVVHEYCLTARVDPATGVVTDARATPRVLPYVECPTAAHSAARVVGMPLEAVRDRVRAELRGTGTCTHLNDLLRSLEDVRGLDAAYRAAGG